MIHGRGNGRADCRPVISDADVDSLEILQKPVVVQGERTHYVWGRSKSDEPDAVIGALVDEFGDDRLDDSYAVDAGVIDHEIARLHLTGHVQSENDVNSVRRDFSTTVSTLRSGQSDNHQSRRDDRQQPN